MNHLGSRYLLLAFWEGVGVMAMEIATARILSPVFGASFVIWTFTICLVMAGLAIGYFVGSHILSDEYRGIKPYIFYPAPVLAICALVLIWIGSRLYSIPVYSLLIIGPVFILPQFVALGLLTPLVVRAIVEEGRSEGFASGLVFAVSTLGGILMALVGGLLLIPELGSSYTILAYLITYVLTTFAIVRLSPGHLVNLLSVLVFASLLFLMRTDSSGLLMHKEGILGEVVVADLPSPVRDNTTDRILFVNRIGQTWVDATYGASYWSYPNYLTVIASSLPKGGDALVLGLGGATVANLLTINRGMNVDAVELDEQVLDAARQHFHLQKSIRCFVDDGRHFLKTMDKQYDYIVVDVFQGESPPNHMLSTEALQEMKRKLKSGGLLVINFNGFWEGDVGLPARVIANTILQTGFHCKVVPTYEDEEQRNLLFVASLVPIDLDATEIDLMIEGETASLEEQSLTLSEAKLSNLPVLTDDRPILETLHFGTSRIWRTRYLEEFRKRFFGEVE